MIRGIISPEILTPLSFEDRIKIFDWKTGSGETDELQFLIYALYALEELDFELDKISVTELNLFENYTKAHTFNLEQIEFARKYINDSMESMKSYLSDPHENTALMSNFPRTEDRKICELCNFQKICFDLD